MSSTPENDGDQIGEAPSGEGQRAEGQEGEDRSWTWWIVGGVALLAAAIAALTVWLGGDDEDVDAPTADLVQTLADDPQYSTLSRLLSDAELDSTLSEVGPFTMFAPNDDAFDRLPDDTRAALEADTDALREVLGYHVVTGGYAIEPPESDPVSFPIEELVSGTLPTTSGGELDVRVDGSVARVDDAVVVAPDTLATNGIVQGIDQVLIPPGLELRTEPDQTVLEIIETDQDLSTLAGIVDQSDLGTLLASTGPYTFFAPTNEAFATVPADTLDRLTADPALLTRVLAYHVVPADLATDELETGSLTTLEGSELTVTRAGSDVAVDDASLIPPERPASNGVVHAIDAPLVPPGVDLTAPPTDSLDELIDADPQLTTLAVLVEQAGMTDVLASLGPLTMFAPTNGAFDAVDPDVFLQIATDPALLRQVLANHVVSGSYTTEMLQPGNLESLEGSALTVTRSNATVQVDGATLVPPEKAATNGMLHVIDQVLVPSDLVLPPPTTTTAATTTAAPTTAPATTPPPPTPAPTSAPTTLPVATLPATTAPPTTAPVATLPIPPPEAQTCPADISTADVPAGTALVQCGLFQTAFFVDRAGLTDELDDPSRDLTLFAPTERAWTALNEEDPELYAQLMFGEDPSLEALRSEALLGYVVDDRAIPTAEMSDGASVDSAAGRPITFAATGATGLTANGAPVDAEQRDITVSNGVIQVVDGFFPGRAR